MTAPVSSAPAAPSVAARPYGGHSLSARLRRVLVRLPAPPAAGEEWRELGYPRPVDHARTERQHAAFRTLLADEGAEVIEAGAGRAGAARRRLPLRPVAADRRGGHPATDGKARAAGRDGAG